MVVVVMLMVRLPLNFGCGRNSKKFETWRRRVTTWRQSLYASSSQPHNHLSLNHIWLPIQILTMAHAKQMEQSDYEAQRAANIAQNKALIQKLQLDSASVNLSKAVNKSKPVARAPSRKQKPAVKKEADEFGPRRTSSRLAGLTADGQVAKRKAEDEYEAIQQAARAKRQRVSGDLDLCDIVVAGKTWDKSENFLVDALTTPKYARTFTEEDVAKTGDKELKALRERMSGLKLYEGFSPNGKSCRGDGCCRGFSILTR